MEVSPAVPRGSAAPGGAGVALGQLGAEGAEEAAVETQLGLAGAVEAPGLLEAPVGDEGPVQHREAEPGHVQLAGLGGGGG